MHDYRFNIDMRLAENTADSENNEGCMKKDE
jgi:hypothetical protein